jgi:hypothetical protein
MCRPWRAGFVGGRHVERREPPRRIHHGESLDLAGAVEGERLPGLRTRQIEMTGEQILHDRCNTAIRHELEFRAGVLLQINQTELRAGACADRGAGGLVGIGLQPGNQLFEVVRRQIAPPDQPELRRGERRDWRQVFQQIEGQRIERATADMRGPLAEADGVAVRRGARHARRADGAAGAAHIFHDHRLAERYPHALGDDARENIGAAARRERHDHGDGLRGKIFGVNG